MRMTFYETFLHLYHLKWKKIKEGGITIRTAVNCRQVALGVFVQGT